MRTKMRHTDIAPELNDLTGEIVDAMIEVHRQLGPGLLESIYSEALAHELQLRGRFVRREVPIPLEYKSALLGGGFRIDLLVEDKVIIEVKAAEALVPVNFAQIDSYLRLSGLPVGFLVNFHAELLKGNYHRRVNERAAR